jgi:hypothetical protein
MSNASHEISMNISCPKIHSMEGITVQELPLDIIPDMDVCRRGRPKALKPLKSTAVSSRNSLSLQLSVS